MPRFINELLGQDRLAIYRLEDQLDLLSVPVGGLRFIAAAFRLDALDAVALFFEAGLHLFVGLPFRFGLRSAILVRGKAESERATAASAIMVFSSVAFMLVSFR